MTSERLPVVPSLELPAPSKRRRLWWILGLVVALGAATAGAVLAIRGSRGTRNDPEGLKTYTVERGDLRITVTESGTLKAKQSVRLWPDIQGRAKVAWLVDEGVTVDSGDVLVLMETDDLEKSIADVEIQLRQAISATIQAEEQRDIQKHQNTADVKAAQVKRDIATLELQRYQEGEVPKQRRAAELGLAKAVVDEQLAREDLEGMEDYVKKGYFTKQDHEQRKLRLVEAIDGLETARRDLDLLNKYQIPKDLVQKQSDLHQAESSLQLVTRKATSQLAEKEAKLEERRFVEQLRRDRLQVLQERLVKMVIRAPQKGLVIYGDDRRWWRRDEIKVGMDVSRGRVILTLPDLDEMEVQISINEVDLDKVQVDRPATVTLDAYPTLTFVGRVTKVSKLAERSGRWSGSDIKTFEVIVELDMEQAQRELAAKPDRKNANGGRLRPGMSAKAEIDAATFTDVLYVPIDVPFEQDGEHFCYVLVNGTHALRPIEIGVSNPTHVEVKKGLAEGDRVLRYDPKRGDRRRRPSTRPAGRGRGRAGAGGARTQPATRPASRPRSRPAESARRP